MQRRTQTHTEQSRRCFDCTLGRGVGVLATHLTFVASVSRGRTICSGLVKTQVSFAHLGHPLHSATKELRVTSCKITVIVESITVVSNGDLPGSKPNHAGGLQNNAISATLDYPRGGVPAITSLIQADIQDNQLYAFDTSDFYGPTGDGVRAPGLFKDEAIEDECPLMIEITSNDNASHLTLILEKVFSNLLGAAVFVVPGGQIVSAALEFAAGSVGDLIAGQSKGSVQVIGAAHVMLKVTELLAGPSLLRMRVPLIAPKTIHERTVVAGETSSEAAVAQTSVEAHLITAGQPNGSITLRINIQPG